MAELEIRSSLTYAVEAPTSFVFSVIAARTPFQSVVSERVGVTVDGEPDTAWQLVPFGAGSQLVRLTADPGELTLSYEADVSVDGQTAEPADLDEIPFGDISADVLPYLNPSRFCESDKLGAFAQREFSDAPRGHGRVRAVADWVRDSIVYEAGSTDGSSGATDVLLQRAGVCRDFAHVAISLCRALGVPARYVSGYGLGVEPQDFHGFFEAYIGTDWYLFDPTGMAMTNTLVRIGVGRDAADTPFATLVGRAALLSKVVEVSTIGDLPSEPAATSTA